MRNIETKILLGKIYNFRIIASSTCGLGHFSYAAVNADKPNITLLPSFFSHFYQISQITARDCIELTCCVPAFL